MPAPITRSRYDVIIAGARCAGASTAMLLARQGMRVLVVDPTSHGSDTLSTHALMRGGVLQLHRWGVLDAIRSAGTPAIRTTTFHYAGDDAIEVPIKERDGVDALYAPRRTLLDAVLVDAAVDAGAEVVHGYSVVDLLWSSEGRVAGAKIAGTDRIEIEVAADLVIGADGVRSRIARILGADLDYAVSHRTASIYGYKKDLGLDGFQWFYNVGAAVGSIPTNDGDTCVFASLPPARFENDRKNGLEALYRDVLSDVSPDLAKRVAQCESSGKLRAFPGITGFRQRPSGGKADSVGRSQVLDHILGGRGDPVPNQPLQVLSRLHTLTPVRSAALPLDGDLQRRRGQRRGRPHLSKAHVRHGLG